MGKTKFVWLSNENGGSQIGVNLMWFVCTSTSILFVWGHV
jgi:hypothetical protein